MKKVLAILLAVICVAGVFAACGGEKEEGAKAYEGTISDLIAKIYEENPIELPVMDAMEVALDDEYTVNAYLGLDKADDIKEAYYSETMIGSQPYSLVVARVNDIAKTEEVKTAMAKGINMRKWICVEANQLTVVSAGDLILLFMADTTELVSEDYASKIVETFKNTVGALTGETLGADVQADK